MASLRRRYLLFKRLPRKTPELVAVIEQLDRLRTALSDRYTIDLALGLGGTATV